MISIRSGTTLRPGYADIAPGVSMPIEELRAPPHLNRNHIDGPLLSWGGQFHWLTLWERFALALGAYSVDDIAEMRWSHYRRWHP
jgi:hypothetical protein